jgi:hypothetical protein
MQSPAPDRQIFRLRADSGQCFGPRRFGFGRAPIAPAVHQGAEFRSAPIVVEPAASLTKRF